MPDSRPVRQIIYPDSTDVTLSRRVIAVCEDGTVWTAIVSSAYGILDLEHKDWKPVKGPLKEPSRGC